MKLTVFGATGRTGIPLIQQALAEGHSVTAFLRDPAKLPIQHERLTIIQGDVNNPTDVERAVAGVDAVISTIGPARNSPTDLMTTAARNITSAMQKHGIKRLIVMTGAGVGAPEDQPKPINHFIKFMLKTLSPGVLKASEEGVAVVQNAPLDWTVVRVPMLSDGEHTGKYRVGWVGVNTGPRIVRADAADFMLKQVQNQQFVRKMPMVSN
jgi:putative NADH-flavin reductase